jgi:hypothetical protein
VNIPDEILDELEYAIENLDGFGEAELRITYHDGRPRYVITSAKSIFLDPKNGKRKITSGQDGQ